LKGQRFDSGDGQADLVFHPGGPEFLDPQRGDDPAVLLADEPGKAPLVHQFEVIADGTLTGRKAQLLHPPGDQARSYSALDFIEDPQDQEGFSLDIFLVG